MKNFAFALLMSAISSSALAQPAQPNLPARAIDPDEIAVAVTNRSEPVLCAEKDNIQVDFAALSGAAPPASFRVQAAHPAFIGAITGGAIARKTSFLLDALDTEVFGAGITIIDDPHRVRGLRSKPFDGEGLPTAPRALVQNGRLTGWLMDSAAARQLGAAAPTGHAVRGAGGSPGVGASNVHLEAGSLSVAELIADIEEGVFVTELIGHGVNGVTGDYSRGASGLRMRPRSADGTDGASSHRRRPSGLTCRRSAQPSRRSSG